MITVISTEETEDFLFFMHLNPRAKLMHFLYRLLSKSINITLYRIIILPVSLFGRENLSLAFSDEHRLNMMVGR